MKKPGMRTIKTAISVLIGASIIQIVNFIFNTHFDYFFVGISAVFSMQKTEDLSKDRAKNRVLGTIIGAAVGLILSFIRFNIPFNINLVLLFFGIIVAISIVDEMNLKAGVMIACIMVIASFSDREASYLSYTIVRTIETILGSYIAVFVNKNIFPYKKKKIKAS